MKYFFTSIIFIFFTTHPSLAAPCIDTDGDGWGWDGTQSCQNITNNLQPQAGDCIDSDGDGWGWNGVSSCKIGSNVQPGECIDSDGDGWGWDGVKSCRINIINTSTTIPKPTPTTLPVTTTTTPQEPSFSSDSNPLFNSLSRNSFRILFVGNSYMAARPPINGSPSQITVARQITELIKVDIPGAYSTVRSIGGGTLKDHWDAGENRDSKGKTTARYEIANGNYDLVILQGRYDIHENNANKNRFETYADRFADFAKNNNTKVLFYGLWARDQQISSSGGDTFGPIAHRIYRDTAIRNNVSYAPNGMAYGNLYNIFSRNMSDDQVENIFTYDSIHPHMPLAYMAANVVYGTIFGRQAPNLDQYRPPIINNEIGNEMRNIAWKAVREYSYSVR